MSASRPYAWHQKNVARAKAAYDAAHRKLSDHAFARGHMHIRLGAFWKNPDYADICATIDAARSALTDAQNLAIEAKCAYRDPRGHGDCFEWYTSAEARKRRRRVA